MASDVEDIVELKHELPALPYAYAALEPHIDARTMALHHDKHHATYVEKLNAELEKHPSLRERSAVWLMLHLEKVPEKARVAIRNNAGGHVNHSMFWRAMSPGGGRKPAGALADAIKRDFDGFEQFKTQFAEAGAKVFGSGWVWLVRSSNGAGRLQIVTTAGHDNPMMQGLFPLMVNDVWEHAYYLKHENRRPDYLKGWWAVADWTEAARPFDLSGASAQKRWESDGGLSLK